MRFERPKIHVEQPKSAFAEGQSRWTNKDLDPVPIADRKWGPWSFIAYWISDAFNAATWQFAASIIAVGLTWKESLGAVALAFFIISWVIAFNGATGVIYHCPFPVLSRASWGFWGSYFPIVSRVILATFWFAIQVMNGANAVRVMIGAIWPSFLTLPNAIPESQGITTNTMVSFFLFWLAHLPFLYIHPNKLRWLFIVKSIIVPIAWLAIMIWAFKAGGTQGLHMQTTTISGSAYSWAFLASLNSVIGNFATLSVNQADFSRYSKVSPYWQALYVPMLPAVFTFVAFIGIISAAAGQVQYGGELLWDPMALVSMWPSRAGQFFAGFSFALAALGVNISANSLSAANDYAALFPRYINIRRGQLVCAMLAWALVPWKILASAGSFLNFMAAYAVFLGPIAAILLFDFWLLHGHKYDAAALYQPDGIYRYTYGVNWRAAVACLIGIVPNLPGFIYNINTDINVGSGLYPYDFGWLLGFVGTSIVYLGLSYAFPARETMLAHAVLPEDVIDGTMYVDGRETPTGKPHDHYTSGKTEGKNSFGVGSRNV